MKGIPNLTLPFEPSWAESVWHLFVVRHPQRDALQSRLAKNEIGTLIHYPVPPHLSGAYQDAGIAKGSLPLAESIASTVLSIPIGPHLSVTERKAVMGATREVAGL
jgi:dTDP-4-amino-4,6-dideoxygalactose transaminase